MKVYLLVYDEDIREERLLKFLDSRKEILDWMTALPSSILLVSRHSPRQLTKLFSKKYPAAQFVLTELETKQTDGMLPEECWDFINSSVK
jgi:hypothetical protein